MMQNHELVPKGSGQATLFGEGVLCKMWNFRKVYFAEWKLAENDAVVVAEFCHSLWPPA